MLLLGAVHQPPYYISIFTINMNPWMLARSRLASGLQSKGSRHLHVLCGSSTPSDLCALTHGPAHRQLALEVQQRAQAAHRGAHIVEGGLPLVVTTIRYGGTVCLCLYYVVVSGYSLQEIASLRLRSSPGAESWALKAAMMMKQICCCECLACCTHGATIHGMKRSGHYA